MKTITHIALALLGLLLQAPILSAAQDGAPPAADVLAQQLLQAAGFKQGLVLHVDCGRPQTTGLTAALAQQNGLLVHGLAFSEAATVGARQAIEAAGVAGRAMVEQLSAPPLPYLDDLANAVVVEDLPELEAKGLAKAELLRVLAPGGVLCVLEKGQVLRTVKPRPAEMDDWTHPQHGPDGNMVSTDHLISFPLGFRWLEGIPVNVNRWAGCRGWVEANGRVFTLSSTELENVAQGSAKISGSAGCLEWAALVEVGLRNQG